MSESFREFKESFFYGSRADLSFKFLASLSDEAAADFIEQLLVKVIDALDDGDWRRVVQQVIEGQTLAYGAAGSYVYDSGPFTPLTRPLPQLRVGLLTSSGHFAAGDDPEPLGRREMTQQEAMDLIKAFLREPPQLSTVPIGIDRADLMVRHGGYDIRGAQLDPEVVLPLRTLQAMAADGQIGALHDEAYSFVGACAQTPLRKETGPEWVAHFQEQGIEAMVMVPA